MEKNKISIFHFEDDSSSYEEQQKEEKNYIITTDKNPNKNKSFDSSDSNSSADDKNKNNNKEIIEEMSKFKNDNNNDKINDEKFGYIDRNKTPNTIEKELLESIEKRENVTKENLALAEKINFKNKPDKIMDMDEFGFIKCKTENGPQLDSDMKLRKEELLTVNARTEKWRQMINNFEVYRTKKIKKKNT